MTKESQPQAAPSVQPNQPSQTITTSNQPSQTTPSSNQTAQLPNHQHTQLPWLPHFISALCNRRLAIVFAQGFASGLPLAIIGSTLQTWFAISGVSLLTIGALTLIGQPYVYKFIWSPLLDRYTPPFLGRRRGWMLITQLGISAAIFLFSFFDPVGQTLILVTLALITAFLSATQDTAIDAYRTELFPPQERGMSVAVYAGGYRMAILVSSGGALIVADYLGWEIMYQIMASLMLLAALLTLFASPEPARQAAAPTTLHQAIAAPLHEFWQRSGITAILAFVLLYKLTDVVALSLGSKFLLDLGFSLTAIGTVYKGVGLLAVLAGTFCGGVLMVRISLFAALLWFGVLQACSNLAFAWLALVGKNMTILTIAVFGENFCSGLATVAFLSFLMHICNLRYTATQFAVLISLAAVGRTYFGPLVGLLAQNLHVVVNHDNWAIFYYCAFAAAIPGLALLFYLRHKKIFDAPQPQATLQNI